MARTSAIKLLLIGFNDDNAEDIISTFRRAGKVAHSKLINDGKELQEQLSDSHWDLAFFDAVHSKLSIAQCGQILRHANVDLPFIYLSDDENIPLPDTSVSLVLSNQNRARLLFFAQRELEALASRRELDATKAALLEEQQRNALLLDSHQDAVCYITDGMIIYANALFCQQVGHDDLDGFPIVDLICNKDQDRFKNALKKQPGNSDGHTLEISFLSSDEQELKSSVTCNNASYDGEACVQLTLHEAGSGAATGHLDATTGLANRKHFAQLLQDFVDAQRNSNSSLIVLQLDNFDKFRRDLNLHNTETLIQALSERLQALIPAQYYGRIADDLFAVIAHHVPSQRALETSQEALKAIESEIIEVKKQSLQCHFSAAIMPINHLTTPHAATLLDQCFETVQSIAADGGNAAEIYHRDRQQLQRSDEISTLIEEAFADQRLQILFQPIINLSDAEGDYYEASLDIRDWQEGEVTAGEMLRVVEKEPNNNKLDRWIVVETTKVLAKKRAAGEDTKLTINLSGNVFHDSEFCSWLSVAMKAAGLPGSALILQFSEESIASSLKPALDCCRQLESLGIGLAVRNFGRSQDGNKFLEHIKPALIKPGVRKTDSLSADEIREIIQGGRQLNSRVLIPNVSSAASLAVLWQLGPDFIQGSYVQDPSTEMSYEFAAFG
ncbi:EAL domain-containing protein [Spongiibacter marinus]|uniref:EAL domain-containing protein n=1 Tax=Spongiibacter marinus TaxID=354246 RepID=UPI0019615853|nr:EAL domain-containing protein [Spongiibacter marinus]MBM7423506.1 diguanylate cyclase (GGDEF)-like protein [Spongiibacter marinus]